MKTIFYLAGMVLVCLLSCRKHNDQPPTDAIDPDFPKEGVTVKTALFGRVVNEKDEPLARVTIKAGNKTATTDENGIYSMEDVQLDVARGYILATKSGYFNGHKVVPAVKDGLTRPMVIKMLPKASLGIIQASAGGSVGTVGGTRLELPPNAIDGYDGPVNVVAAYLNPTRSDFPAISPGDMEAINSRNERTGMISYGMTHMQLLDNNGNELKIKQGMEVTLGLPIPESLKQSAEATIPLWYFDETKGIWIEEGSATLQNGSYVGKVNHFSVWNADRPAKLFKFLLDIAWPAVNTLSPVLGQALTSGEGIMLLVELYDDNGNLADEKIIYSKPGDVPKPITSQAFSDGLKPIVRTYPPPPGPNPNIPGPDYPATKPGRYSPVGDEIPPPSEWTPPSTLEGDGTRTTGNGSSTVELEPVNGAGDGVSVQGRAVDCNGQNVNSGYARIAFKQGTTTVASTIAPIYIGQGGAFYGYTIIPFGTPNTIDNIELIAYDAQANRKSAVQKIPITNTKAVVLSNPIEVCDDPDGPAPNLKQVANATIRTMAELQTFINEGYEAVSGTLHIEGSEITDLGGITQLKEVAQLRIVNTAITSLGGLANLQAIYYGLDIGGNTSLTSVDFPKLTNRKFIAGFSVSNSPKLTAIRIPSIRSACENGVGIRINNNPLLTTLQLPDLININNPREFWIWSTGLRNLDMFANITGALPENERSDFKVSDNPVLQSMTGLRNITAGYRVEVANNPALTSLSGLKLYDRIGLENFSDAAMIHINGNTALTDITLPVAHIYGELSVARNGNARVINLPNLISCGWTTIADNNALRQLNMPKTTRLQMLYGYLLPELATLEIPLLQEITGTDGRNGQLWLSSLAKLSTVSLPALKRIGGRLIIESCAVLKNTNGFSNLESVATDFAVRHNSALASFCGFNKLINGNGIGGGYEVQANDYNPTRNDIKAGRCAK